MPQIGSHGKSDRWKGMLRFHTHAKSHPARSWHGFVAHAYCGGQRHSTTNILAHHVSSTRHPKEAEGQNRLLCLKAKARKKGRVFRLGFPMKATPMTTTVLHLCSFNSGQEQLRKSFLAIIMNWILWLTLQVPDLLLCKDQRA